MLQFDQFTVKSQDVLTVSQQRALQVAHPHCDEVHVLQALLDVPYDYFAVITKKLDVSIKVIREKCSTYFASQPTVSGGQPSLSQALVHQLNHAQSIAQELGDAFVSCAYFIGFNSIR